MTRLRADRYEKPANSSKGVTGAHIVKRRSRNRYLNRQAFRSCDAARAEQQTVALGGRLVSDEKSLQISDWAASVLEGVTAGIPVAQRDLGENAAPFPRCGVHLRANPVIKGVITRTGRSRTGDRIYDQEHDHGG